MSAGIPATSFMACVLVGLLTSTCRGQEASARKIGSAVPVPVTAENFPRSESDLYFGGVVKDGGFGRFHHNRELTPLDNQTVIRMNRDTLYSGAVFDLDAGPVTIALPDTGKQFMSMQVIDENHFTYAVYYGNRAVHAYQEDDRNTLRTRGGKNTRRSQRPGGPGSGAQASRRHHARSEKHGQVRCAELGSCESEDDARRPVNARLGAAGLKADVRGARRR